MNLDIDKETFGTSSTTLEVSFTEKAKTNLDSNTRVATFQQSHLMRHRLLLVLPKENLIEEFMSLEYNEEDGFVMEKLLDQ